MSEGAFAALLERVRACRVCAEHLPLGPRPVLRASPTSRLLIIGQAPGTRVHDTGVPWNDRSGERLRAWLALDSARFYDESRVALLPMGMCYPGRAANGGDLPPRPECAPLWLPQILPALPRIRLTLLVGSYAHWYFLGKRGGRTVTETVRAFREHLPRFLPLPHPSWRTTAWERNNPWFGEELLPEARKRVRATIEAD